MIPMLTSINTNIDGGNYISRGTLQVNPALANLGIEDLLEKSDLNFQVGKIQTSYDYLGQHIESKSHSIIRLDTGKELGFGATKEYEPVSYQRAIYDVFGEDISDKMKNIGGIPTRVISLHNGARAAFQFVLPEIWKVAGKIHRTFFNIFGSHDRSSGVGFNTSDICIVCGNTYLRAFASKELRSFAKHTANVHSKLVELSKAILTIRAESVEYYTVLDNAATVTVNSDTVAAFTALLFPDTNGGEKRQSKAADNRRDELMAAINVSRAEREGYTASGALTVYDVFQGALRFTSYKEQKRNADEQFEYVMDGPGNIKNTMAYNWLLEAVK